MVILLQASTSPHTHIPDTATRMTATWIFKKINLTIHGRLLVLVITKGSTKEATINPEN